MKAVKLFNTGSLILSFAILFSQTISAQTENPKTRETPIPNVETKVENQTDEAKKVSNEKTSDAAKVEETKTEEIKTEEIKTAPTPTPVTNTTSTEKEVEESILPFYNNYLKEYRLGPNDVISVDVFGQCPDYCKGAIIVPPTAKISYPLIRDGVFVGGKTVEEVAADITKKLDEYIIDPKVSVTLEKAMSARYSVLGKVAAPGVRVLDRKVSVYEAVVESGGVLKEGDKKRVVIYSYDAQGRITPKTVDLTLIERGKSEMVYLNPGDQVFVPDRGFRLNVNTVFDILSKASIVRLLFGSPF